MYYLRTKPAAQPIQFTVDKTKVNNANVKEVSTEKDKFNMESISCSLQNKDDCLMCGS